MRVIPNWKEVSIDTHSIRFLWAMAWAFILLPDLAYVATGLDLVSPYLRGWGALAFCAVVWLGRILDQGIATARRETLPSPAERLAWFTLFPLAVFGLMVLWSSWGWIVAVLS